MLRHQTPRRQPQGMHRPILAATGSASRWWNWLISRVRWRTTAWSRPATWRRVRISSDNGVSLAGLLGEGEAGGGAGLDGVGLLAAEEGGAVVFVALRIAAGEGEGEQGAA